MKMKVGRRLLRIRKVKVGTCPLPLRFPKLIRRLLNCMRSKISYFNRRIAKTQILNRPSTMVVPQGCVAVNVCEEKRRYVIPIPYLTHPFITKLLQEAEMEFGNTNTGPIALPCTADDFEQIVWLIRREQSSYF